MKNEGVRKTSMRVAPALTGFVAIVAFVTALGAVELPTLSETLQWLSGASEAESANGKTHTSFESDPRNGCSVTITETRVAAGPNFWIKMSFSLADIDPTDIRAEDLDKPPLPLPGHFAVSFHTTNYTKKIIATSSNHTERVPVSDYIVLTNDGFGPRFARAFKNAIELCGGKRSSF
jgi:hypothetical protein